MARPPREGEEGRSEGRGEEATLLWMEISIGVARGIPREGGGEGKSVLLTEGEDLAGLGI